MAVANFMILTSFSAFFLFPLYVLEKGGTELDIGVIMGIFTLASVLCRPWISEMIDRLGRKKSYTIGCATMSALPLAYLLLRGRLEDFYLALLLIRIAHGMGFAICLTAAFTYIADIIPTGRLNEGLGIFGVSGITGSAIGPVIGEFLIDRLGFQGLFLAAGAMGLIAVLAHQPVAETLMHRLSGRSHSFFSALRRPRFAMIAAMAGLFGFGLAASNNFVAPLAVERRLQLVSLYYVAYSTAAVLTRFVGGRVADSVGEERIIPFAMILTGVGLGSLALVETTITLLLAGVLAGLGHGFLYPCLNALSIRGEPIETRGRITGIFTGAIDAGVFVGSLVLGAAGQWAGSRALFFISGAALAAALAVFKCYRSR